MIKLEGIVLNVFTDALGIFTKSHVTIKTQALQRSHDFLRCKRRTACSSRNDVKHEKKH